MRRTKPNRSVWAWLLMMTLILAYAGCSSVDTDQKTSVRPVNTRIMAAVGGILVERESCLRFADDENSDAPSKAIIWQKDVFKIERVGDELHIVDLDFGNPDSPTVWKIGERVSTSGGEFTFWEQVASAEFLDRCIGPYVFVSGAERNSEPITSD
ncbi:hypothetical protein GKN94_00300 [Candidatus Lucifugimonas marina]|uniref:hypothetical protein n=1 Tax=Candidatus Lucifugimonas marina TaxID=3038979 RepID=UPI00279862F5|nr:hypothetical protein GKN94_00300 [SAR202 cluster bacterium JH545]